MITYNNFEYAKIVEKFENGKAIKFEVEKDNQKAFIHYIKRDISNELKFLPKDKYFDLITPFDYGGIYYTDKTILPYFLKKFEEWCQENSIVSMFIRFDPCEEFDYDILSKSINIQKVNDLIYINLESDFYKNYSKGRKSDMNNIKKQNYIISEVDMDDFYRLYTKSMERNKAHKYFYFDKTVLKRLAEKKFARVFGISIDAHLYSSIMILDDIDKSYYFLGGSKNNHLSTNVMLLHQVALMLKREGKKIFFLGGGKKGVYDFKQRFSKKTFPYYIGKKIFDIKTYNYLVKLSKRENNDFFPKYREKII